MKYTLPPFLHKLVAITESVPDSVASWSEDGNSFVVHNSDRFEKLLHKHFKGNLQTFVRQLHFYAFSKVVHGKEWSFQHKNFRRDHPQLIYDIRRKTRKTNGDGVASQQEVKVLRKHITTLQERITAMNKQFAVVQAELAEVKENDRKRAAETSIFPSPYDRSVTNMSVGLGLGAINAAAAAAGTGGFKRQRVSRSISTASNLSLASVGGIDRFTSFSMPTNNGNTQASSSLAPPGQAKRQNSLEILPLMDFMDEQLEAYPDSTQAGNSAVSTTPTAPRRLVSFGLRPTISTGTAPDGDDMGIDDDLSAATEEEDTKIKVEANPGFGASASQTVQLPKDIQLPKDLDPKLVSKVLGSFLAIATACCVKASDPDATAEDSLAPEGLTRSSSAPTSANVVPAERVKDEFNVAMKQVYRMLEKTTKPSHVKA